jgi:putative flippase GtrA
MGAVDKPAVRVQWRACARIHRKDEMHMSKISQLSTKYFTHRLYEVILFIAVGVTNACIDFGILNLLILFTHHYSGWWLIFFNCISFLCAVINSYIFNGRFTFRLRKSNGSWLFLRFISVNIGGLVINSFVVWLLEPVLAGRLSMLLAINVSKVMAVLFSFLWNYFAIRRWVFTSNNESVSVAPDLAQPVPISSHHESQHSLHPVGLLKEETYD